MEVYIELVFIENLIIDFILLLSTAKIGKIKYKKSMLFIASIIATLFSIALPFLKWQGVLLIITKIAMSYIIVFLAFTPKKFKQLFFLDCVFLFLTFLLGGLCVGIYFLGGNINFSSSGVEWNCNFPLSIIVIAIFGFLYFGNQLINHITKKNKINNFFYDLDMYYNNVCYHTVGYLDTANYIIDKKTNSPVILINETTFSKFFNHNEIEKRKSILNGNRIQITTLSDKHRQIPYFLLDRLVIYSSKEKCIHKNVAVAVSAIPFATKINAEVLLSPYLF